MVEQQKLASQNEHENAWRVFLSRVSPWSVKQTHIDSTSREKISSIREPRTSDVVHSIISILAPTRPCAASQSHDVETMWRSLSLFRDAAQEGIITNDEALAITQFVVGWFVQRRFDCILSDVFTIEPGHKYTFRRVAGRLERERESEIAR